MQPTFVQRENELAQLHTLLDKAAQGELQLCLITGELGAGKSALVAEFVRQAQQKRLDLVAASGECHSFSHAGLGDLYLPFRHILRRLFVSIKQGDKAYLERGGVSPQTAKLLRQVWQTGKSFTAEVGPGLLVKLLTDVEPDFLAAALKSMPGVQNAVQVMEAHIAARLQHRPQIAQLEPTFNTFQHEYGLWLEDLAKHYPVILVLDDLHWADQASLDLLVHLVRTLKNSRVLVIGTFRSDESEASGEGHTNPLNKVMANFGRYKEVDALIDLDAARQRDGMAFVEDFLKTKAYTFDADFCKKLFEKTEGSPLFTVEIFQMLQESELIRIDARHRLDVIGTIDWGVLPTTVTSAVDARLENLNNDQRLVLAVASVQGRSFIAQLIPKSIRRMDAPAVVQMLRPLERRHKLIQEVAEEEINGALIHGHQFVHVLVQDRLYRHHLSNGERYYYHQDVAQALEEIYGAFTEDKSNTLANHFEMGGNWMKSAHYLAQSARRAIRLGRAGEAVDLATRGLEQLAKMADSTEKQKTKLSLTLLQGAAYEKLGKLNDSLNWFREALALSDGLAPETGRVKALTGLCVGCSSQADWESAQRFGIQAVELAQTMNDEATLADAEMNLGLVFLRRREPQDFEDARLWLQRALERFKAVGSAHGVATTLVNLSDLENELKEFAVVEAHLQEALEVFESMGDEYARGAVLSNLGVLAEDQCEYTKALHYYDDALEIAKKIGDQVGIATNHANIGDAYIKQNDLKSARARYKEAIKEANKIPDHAQALYAFCGIAKVVAETDGLAAAKLIGYILHDDACDTGTHKKAEELLAEIRKSGSYADDAVNAAVAEGEKMTDEAAVAQYA